MIIRELSEEDFAGIKKLVFQVHKLHLKNRPDIYNDVDPFERRYFEFLIHDEKTLALVCENEGRPVGFCVVSLREPSENPLLKARKVAFVEDLCVDEQCRKMGIGKALMAEVQQRAKAKGAAAMELTVWAFNENAVKFYEKLGMSPRSITMEKPL